MTDATKRIDEALAKLSWAMAEAEGAWLEWKREAKTGNKPPPYQQIHAYIEEGKEILRPYARLGATVDGETAAMLRTAAYQVESHAEEWGVVSAPHKIAKRLREIAAQAERLAKDE